MNSDQRFFAHTLDGRPPADWEELGDHLDRVACRAAGFGERIGSGEWARVAGLWHDLGKYSPAFQAYLKSASSPDPHRADQADNDEDDSERTAPVGRIDHSTAGAQHAVSTDPMFGQLLAYVIAGHHSGLLDWCRDGACLSARLKKVIEPWSAAPAALLQHASSDPPPPLRSAFGQRGKKRGFAAAFFTRMLFSCLVDADYLETERFMTPQRSAQRPRWPDDLLARMTTAVDDHVAAFKPEPTPVNRQRAVVRQACLDAAHLDPGLFSLTVPTGGGKTLSSLAFALHHARRWNLDRVIYVAPFTTIIEQNADAFRKALGSLADAGLGDPIVEHHSNLDVGKETQTSRLAAENWDAPLIVTTSVQFYESLFANRTSRCRKLHNLASSVIVLDEAQSLPVDLLAPCLRVLEELTRSYSASVVLCTATQPAIHLRDDFPIGLAGVREIIGDPPRLYTALQRVEVRDVGRIDDAALAERLAGENQVLCIVNTRGHARALFEALADTDDLFHLSALMCPQHRSERLAVIRDRLAKKRPCRVISTQLIEAGVDIDFPAVYRSLAGLDSIAQAAGRCNRNGGLPGKGRVLVFRSQHERSESFVAEAAGCARQMLALHPDPLALAAIEHYFRLYFWQQSERWDAKSILGDFKLLNRPQLPFSFAFADVARRFRLIEDSGQAVLIPWGEAGRKLCEDLRQTRGMPDRLLLRRLQRYTVQVPNRVINAQTGRSIELVHDRFLVLTSPEINYSETIGLQLDDDVSAFLHV